MIFLFIGVAGIGALFGLAYGVRRAIDRSSREVPELMRDLEDDRG